MTVFLVALFLGVTSAGAQRVRPESLPQGFVIVVEDVSQAASASRPIYMAGAHNTWDPGDADYVLSPRSDKRWQIVIEGGTFGLNSEFKFTLGGWASVETDGDGQDIVNRTLPDVDISGLRAGEKPVVELSVPRFRDGSEVYIIAPEYRPLEVSGRVSRLQVAGGAGAADGKMRDLLIWTPPGYGASGDREYPVVYILDGQNVFQDHALVPGEWRLDETATAMIQGGLVEPFIAVAVPSFADARVSEYMPPLPGQMAMFRGERPTADRFARWLSVEVMPKVERAFRVSNRPERTAIAGASLGGLFALYAGSAMGDRFGLVLAESPAVEVHAEGADFELMPWLAGQTRFPRRVFIGMGGAEDIPGTGFFDRSSGRHVEAAARLFSFYGPRSDAALMIVADAVHDETAWADRLPAALAHLFPPVADALEEQAELAERDRRNNTVDPQALGRGVRLVVTPAPGAGVGNGPIYLAGNHNGWNAGDPAQRLSRQADGTWAIELPEVPTSQRFEFKFTLGSWDRVETAADGSEIDNRTLPAVDASRLKPGERPEYRFAVPAFRTPQAYDNRDMLDPARPLDVTGDVRRLRVAGGGGEAATAFNEGHRDLLVWLPPQYDDPEHVGRVFPTLYLLDGQNVFEHAPGLPGEWHADEAAAELIASGRVEPMLIVAIPNSGRYRADEYIPAGWGTLRGVEPSGHEFLGWIASEVIPAVESAFRVDPDPARRAIGGASLGGLMALYATLTRPDLFGLGLVESCSMLSRDGSAILDSIAALPPSGASPRLVLGMGTMEVSGSDRDADRNAAYAEWPGRVARAIRDRFPGAELNVNLVVGHRHEEPAWAARFPGALARLFPMG